MNKNSCEAVNSYKHVAVWTAHGFDKMTTEQEAPAGALDRYTVYLAKREAEGVHIALRSESDIKSLSFSLVSGGYDGIECQIYRVRALDKIDGKSYTDPCVPMYKEAPFDMTANETAVIYVDFKTTPDTPAGDYPYGFALVDKNGNVLTEASVTVHVWDFAMPEARKFETSCGLSSMLSGGARVSPKEHYDFLLSYGLSPYRLPYDILDERADEYMSDPRVTSFVVKLAHDTFDDDTVIAWYNKLKTNPEWLKKAYFYPIDEPSTPELLYEAEKRCRHLREICPEIRICIPYYTDVQLTDDMDQIDFMNQFVDYHCPKLANWDDDIIYSEEQKKKYPTFAERAKAQQARGDKVLAYVCNIPELPYLNVKVNEDGINHRIVMWQMYQRDVDGFLYWHSNMPKKDVWKNVDYFGQGWHGDGILEYPGDEVGLEGQLVPSIRLIIMRDGLEDIELLYMAEELLGHEWVKEKANSVSRTLTSVDVTSDEFASLRIEIGNAVEQALKNR